jgi:uncharacterized protein YkwD
MTCPTDTVSFFTAVPPSIFGGSPRTLPSRADEAGGTAVKFYELRDNLHRFSWTGVVVASIIGALLIGGLTTGELQRGIDWARSQHRQPTDFAFGVGVPGLTLRTAPLHRDDPWASYLAPESICPGRSDSSASPGLQAETALCLLNYARQEQGLPALAQEPQVSTWSALKASDITRCNEFSHEPCREPADVHARDAGYRGAWGENIYLGPGSYKTPLAAVDGWLNSPHHRENLFRPEWRAQGIAVLHVASFRGRNDVAIWVSEFTDE